MHENEQPGGSLTAVLKNHATPSTPAGGSPWPLIGTGAVQDIARCRGILPRQVEIAALGGGILPARYRRNRDALGNQDQLRLLASTVAVVGLGGLGGTVAEILARIGIGRLILIDGDRFEESNLNRQLNCTAATIGTGKASAASARIAAVNPSTETTAHGVFLTAGNAPVLIDGTDAIADCLDSLPARFILEAAAAARNIPMVSAAVAGWAGQVTAIYPHGPGLSAIYGDPAKAPEKGVEAISGNLAHTVWTVASIEAGEIVNALLGRSALAGRLLILDLAEAAFEIIDLAG